MSGLTTAEFVTMTTTKTEQQNQQQEQEHQLFEMLNHHPTSEDNGGAVATTTNPTTTANSSFYRPIGLECIMLPDNEGYNALDIAIAREYNPIVLYLQKQIDKLKNETRDRQQAAAAAAANSIVNGSGFL
jgi:hypothetical protein